MTLPAVRIDRLAAGGDGVGRLEDGRVVFVPRSAPGDLVELDRIESKARFARAEIGRLVEPGPGRTEPRCPHYLVERCGGCQLQHLTVPVQRDVKRQIVADALARIGKVQVGVPEVQPSGLDWEYRSRVHLAVGPGRRFAGFHPFDDPARVFPLVHCHIAAPALMELWRRLAPVLHLLPPDVEQLQLRLDPEGTPHLVVRTPGGRAWSEGKSLGHRLGAPGVVWWHPGDGAPRVVAGGSEAYPATVFEQVNPALGAAIRAWAVEQLGEVRGRVVWDLYAGIGDTSAALSAGGAIVESVELDRRAVEQAERQAPGTARRHAGRAEDLVPRLGDPALVITNPPRAGMDKSVVADIVRRRPGRVVYVSCDPATLARDIAGLSPAYRVVAVQAFDLFPQTAHVETVAVLEVA